MTQDKKDDKKSTKDGENVKKKSDVSSSTTAKETKAKTDADYLPKKIVIRRLPPSWNSEIFLEQIDPVPENDYYHFVPADLSLGQNAFCCAYLNILNRQDITVFMEKFDGYVFIDSKGVEYPAVVEFAPFSKVPKKRAKKADPRKGTIETDAEYLKFLGNLQNSEPEAVPTPDSFLEEIEAREKQQKENVPVTTPLIEFMIRRREEKKLAALQAQQAREDKRRKDLERRKREEEMRLERERQREKQKQREKEERAKRKEEAAKNSATSAPTQMPVKLLKNPEREKEHELQKEKAAAEGGRSKHSESSRFTAREAAESDRREKRETSSRQSTDNRSGSNKQGKFNDEDERSYKQGRHREAQHQASSSKMRQDRHYPESEDQQKHVEKRTDKHKESIAQRTDESEKQKADEHDQNSKSKVVQQREERRQKPTDTKTSGGSRDSRDSRYQKEKRDSRYGGSTKDYKEKDRRSELDDRDYKDREKKDHRKDDGYHRSNKTDVKGNSQSRDSGADRGQGNSRREESSTTEGYGDRKPGGGLRRSLADFAESESGKKPTKERTPDHGGHESSPAADSGRETTDRRSVEKEYHSSGSGRQRVRYKDRPERAIYNPARRAVERKKEEQPSSTTQSTADNDQSQEER